MGALKNAAKRKTHKERSQPLSRRKYGLLEKKKDYRLRARDYHKKEDTLQVLRRKAEERNPDEFYFGMQNAQTKDGVHVKESAVSNKFTQEELLLMKTQDVKYVALKAQTEAKRIEKLQQRLHFVGASQSRRTIFVDDQEQLRDAQNSQAPEELLDRGTLRNLQSDYQGAKLEASAAEEQEAQLNRFKAAAYSELMQRTERHEKLQRMLQEMTRAKELMKSGAVRKLKPKSGEGEAIYKWKIERKK